MEQYQSYLIPYLVLLIGVLSRAVVPWLVKLYKGVKNGESVNWDWSYLTGQLIFALAVMISVPVLVDNLPDTLSQNLQLVFMAGWAVADVGRLVEKFASAVRA